MQDNFYLLVLVTRDLKTNIAVLYIVDICIIVYMGGLFLEWPGNYVLVKIK